MKLEEYIKEQCLEVQIFLANERLVNEGFINQVISGFYRPCYSFLSHCPISF